MSELYSANHLASIEEMAQSDEIFEAFLIDDLMHGSTEDLQKFCESAECQILIEKQVLNKPTVHRLSKEDDLKRRVKIICYTLAKEANDPMWTKLVKFQKLKKQFSQKIFDKYNKKAVRIAKAAQKEYIKKAKGMQATESEKKAQAAR